METKGFICTQCGAKDFKEEGDDNNKNIDDNDSAAAVTMEEQPWILPDSDIKNCHRRICVVTTAALPWRTGTAVNPILRALYLTRGRPKHFVSLVIPWCPNETDRQLTLGTDHSFCNQQEQEAWIRSFCRDRAGCAGTSSFFCVLIFLGVSWTC